MSNLEFKKHWEMTIEELHDYVCELETRVGNANSGARLFKEEANLTRTELLKWKEIAGQADDKFVEMTLFFERHIEALYAVAAGGYDCAIEQSDFITIVRLLRHMLRAVLHNHRKIFMGEEPDTEKEEDWSDIPF
jgi:hypothetical protein